MSEKVKLTREQAEAIETKKGTRSASVAKHLEGWTWKENKCLNDLSMEQFVKALYIGYEVEETFKVGDFVDIGLFGISKIAEVTGVKGNTIAINGSEEYHKFKINRVLTDEEKQEEKQRRWWAKHGRKPWKIREDDILICPQGDVYTVQKILDGIVVFKEGGDKPKWEIKSGYRVACFAEDRKDVDHAE